MTDTPDDPFARTGGPAAPPPGPAQPWSYGLPARRQAPAAAPVVALVGLAVAATGLFALPLDSGVTSQADVGFTQAREFAGSSPRNNAFFSGLATFWWQWGAFTVGALLVVLLCLAVSRVATVAVGIGLAVVALAGGIVHLLATKQSADFANAARNFGGYAEKSFFDNAAAGIPVALVGFAVVLVGGVVIAATGRHR